MPGRVAAAAMARSQATANGVSRLTRMTDAPAAASGASPFGRSRPASPRSTRTTLINPNRWRSRAVAWDRAMAAAATRPGLPVGVPR